MLPSVAAQRQKRYRDRRREAGLPPARGGKTTTLFDRGQFIAIDGEGINVGDSEETVLSSGSRYTSRSHEYRLLSSSTGREVASTTGRLSAQQALDFLLSEKRDNPGGIFVCFAGGYDVNQMFLYDLPKEKIRRLARGEKIRQVFGNNLYEIEYRSRKCLTIWRYPEAKIRYRQYKTRGELKWKPFPECHVTLWDVWGFFQGSFVEAMKKWLPKDYPDYDLIVDMKSKRGQFDTIDLDQIREYNQAELRALVEMMNRVRDAVKALGLTVSRWDGSGAISAAMLKKFHVKQFKGETPQELRIPAASAYAGGRIEVMKIGHHEGKIYHYDINSAYPAAMKDLPCLACGKWTHGTGAPPPGFTLVKIRYSFELGLPFYPLFFRSELKNISFPSDGCGWYWYPEYEATIKFKNEFGAREFDVLEYWHFTPGCDHQPFAFVQQQYDLRKEYIDAPNTPENQWKKGAEKTIKLGVNGLYGKTAQQLGGTQDRPPPFFQIEWAGWITSATRAALCCASLEAPTAIISFATDAIFSNVPLRLNAPREKILGLWEAQTHDAMTLVMSGVYWYRDGEKWSHYSRGFDRDTLANPDAVIDAWRNGKSILPARARRFIGAGIAASSRDLFSMRGRFVEIDRSIDLCLGSSQKRNTVDITKTRPDRSMVNTRVRRNAHYLDFGQDLSAPHVIDFWPEFMPATEEIPCPV